MAVGKLMIWQIYHDHALNDNRVFRSDVYSHNSNHTRNEIICHVDTFTLWHKERTLKGLWIGQFAYEADKVYWWFQWYVKFRKFNIHNDHVYVYMLMVRNLLTNR